MEGEDSSGPALYRSCNQSCDGIAAEPIDEVDDSRLVGVLAMVDDAGVGGASAVVDVEMKAEVNGDGCGANRKRGRPPRGQAKQPPAKKKKEEEDVCFICFDGGSLVLCDRRGCPKAYHPACIKRDEAFFRSKAKWNCGWHICSICHKAAHYMCYTCTYSLCKACTKDADYLRVRENKGFCTTCMRTIMLIENNDQGNKEMLGQAQVDFDDKSSWEYLFKVYWIYLKENLSLTLDELTQAKNPWKAAGTVACKEQSLDMHYGGGDGKCSILDSPSGHLEANDSKRRRTRQQPKLPNYEDSLSTDKSSSDKVTTSTGSTEWASKELLDLVAHMKNGDTSVLSQFDVQGLLLDYIKRNNLRDPHQKSQIICDLRLKTLFGKPRVGHIEMLKLLEFHFLIKEDSQKDVIQGNVVDAVLSQVEGGGNNENLLMIGKDKKRKTRRKGEERGLQTNLDEYAAIDVHNINLIYLRRHLMESLFADKEKFHDKVVGSIVRIRISSSDQKQDMYRLVQVVGTCKAAVPYKTGEKTADVMLKILNLDKKETISIDGISNQEFSEDECRRLRQSIKCGLVKLLTVGQVREKAVALEEVRLNDWLETEVLRLNHLRDRASEKGHKKELRECVEKLELLKTPEERQRRLQEIPEVHADPTMDSNCESDEDAGEVNNKKQDEYVKPRFSGFRRNGREPISPRNGDISNDTGNRAWKKLTTCGQSRSMSTKFFGDKAALGRVVERVNKFSWHEGKDACRSNSSEKPGNQVDSSGSVVGGWNNQAAPRSGSFPGAASEISVASLSTGSAPSENDSETEKLWHYQDPHGKIQGPFCMVQLRKWDTTGYFPPDMRIWSINDKEVDSLLLTDVLNGQFHKVFPLRDNISLPSQEVKGPSDSRLYFCDDRRSGSMNTISHSNGNNEFVKGNGSHSWITTVVNNNDVQTGSSSHCGDSVKVNNSYSDKPQVHYPVTSPKFTERQNDVSVHQEKGEEGKRWTSGSNHGSWSSHGNAIFQTAGGHSHENQPDSQGYSGLPVNVSSNNCEINIPNLPSPTPQTCNGDLEGQTTKDQQSLPSNIPVQDSGIDNLPSPTPKPSDPDEKADSSIQHGTSPPPERMDGDFNVDSTVQNLPSPSQKPRDGDEKVQAIENKQSVSSYLPVQDSGPSWSSGSSLVVSGGTQAPDEWGGYSPTGAKPCIEEWDSGLVSSSLKPPDVANNDHAATPTSKYDQLTPPSPSHPATNASSWQVIDHELIEFSTLDEESVSDLLAEVDAMESQCGVGSPTSVMYSAEELFEDSKNDCFTSISGLSPPLDSGKSDALSSTGDIHIPLCHQSTMTDEPLVASQADVLDPVKRPGGQSSMSVEVEVETQPTDISANQSESGSNSQLPASSPLSQDMIDSDTDHIAGPTDWGTMQGNMNLGLGGSSQGMTNMGWGNDMNRSTSAGFMWWESQNQPKYGGERLIGTRDWNFQSGDSGFDKGRPLWSRQSSYGAGVGVGVGIGIGGGGSYSRPSPKGQRVCKFYGSGHCKKGAFCSYLHPS
ncbi:hypothetical protein ACSBR2_009591 [Camellia fascicularis]